MVSSNNSKNLEPTQDAPGSIFLREKSLVGPGGLLPISRSTLWAWVKDGHFPKPEKLGPRVTVWRRSAVEDFIRGQRR